MTQKTAVSLLVGCLLVAGFGVLFQIGFAQAEGLDTSALSEAIRRVEEEPPVMGAVIGSGPCQYPASALTDIASAKAEAQAVLDNRDSN